MLSQFVRWAAVVAACLFTLGLGRTAAVAGGADESSRAEAILDATGTSAGLIVQVGCGDGKLTAALGAREGCLVQGLDVDTARVAAARQYIRKAGMYGRVSADEFDGKHLPYAGNLVNLLVAEDHDDGDVPMAEVMRVLCPGGVAYIHHGGAWAKTVKPRPGDIDEWSHYLHDASGNAVAVDREVGVPRYVRWMADPLWPRSHEYTPSITAMVSSGGRLFYIMDDGIRGLFDTRLPEKWAVYARDAFNGLLLWRHPFSRFGPGEWQASGHWSSPMSLPRRLVSSGDRVYVVLGYRAPVSVLDAASGETIAVYKQTNNADEIILKDGILLAVCRKVVPDYPRQATAWDVIAHPKSGERGDGLPPAEMGDETLVAVDTKTGKTLWEKPEKRIVTLSLAALGGRVCYHTFEELVCLDLASGRQLWQVKSEPWPDRTGTGVTLVMYQDEVLMTSSLGMTAWSAATGKELWRGPRLPRVASREPPDLLIADGLVWTGLTPEMPMKLVPKQHEDAPRFTGTAVHGLDPRTGQIRKTIDIGLLVSTGHHVRCYRGKGTERYLLWPKRGTEFVDIASGQDHMRCDWARGECSYGVMPANGLLYVPPHPCVCYTGVALNGFNALAAENTEGETGRGGEGEKSRHVEAAPRLQRGPAYRGSVSPPSTFRLSLSDDWPTFRHDARRSGSTNSAVAPDVKPLWTATIGGRLTQPVVAERKVFVASIDEHTLYCLDAESGRRQWDFTAGGRIDSPPTVYAEVACLFGSADGWVYCLRATDGQLAWRFRAAPEDRRVVAFGQVESAWPVHGSVLVADGTAYFAAGRSSFLDGGMYLYGLNVATGKIVCQKHLDGPWPDVRKDQGQPFAMEGAKNDVLVSDGAHLHMYQNEFDLKLNQIKNVPLGEGGEEATELYLTSTSGLLDDTLHDRFFWFYNRLWPGSRFAVRGPKTGHILVFDGTTTYGQRAFSRREKLSPKFTPGGEGYLLFADDNQTEPLPGSKSTRGAEFRPSQPPRWSENVPVRALAMVLTKDALFIAGPPDVVSPEDSYAALEGRMGAKLWAVSPKDGSRLYEFQLASPPVFDGLSAAGGRLLVSQADGAVICLGNERDQGQALIHHAPLPR